MIVEEKCIILLNQNGYERSKAMQPDRISPNTLESNTFCLFTYIIYFLKIGKILFIYFSNLLYRIMYSKSFHLLEIMHFMHILLKLCTFASIQICFELDRKHEQ